MMDEIDMRIRAYRIVLSTAVVFSVISIVSIFVTLPMVYNFVHNVKRQVHGDVNFCKGSARDIWSEVHSLKDVNPVHNRTIRDAYNQGGGSAFSHGGSSQSYNAGGGSHGSSGGGCSGCCRPGSPRKRRLPSMHPADATTMQTLPTWTSMVPQEMELDQEAQAPRALQAHQDLKINKQVNPVNLSRETLHSQVLCVIPQVNLEAAREEALVQRDPLGICPKYCAIDGGVFFEDGTRR
ncbi:hypothetical protein WR25_10026 [Diploscapter pachys]|uniref:Nematode cuticle collagen N-terminal domain-containing protein n=1 Tax=Diploscapter pachys TaxID=2018661 RepID=A0A2A2KDQ0_9BILA|nr:hypothetical protein WR25_10026 [Diploscapter pachys]